MRDDVRAKRSGDAVHARFTAPLMNLLTKGFISHRLPQVAVVPSELSAETSSTFRMVKSY